MKSYFASHAEVKSDARLQNYFSDDTTEIYLLFYSSVLPLFSETNKFLQYDESKIHVVRHQLTSFVHKLLGRFIKVSSFKAVNTGKAFLTFLSRFLLCLL